MNRNAAFAGEDVPSVYGNAAARTFGRAHRRRPYHFSYGSCHKIAGEVLSAAQTCVYSRGEVLSAAQKRVYSRGEVLSAALKRVYSRGEGLSAALKTLKSRRDEQFLCLYFGLMRKKCIATMLLKALSSVVLCAERAMRRMG